MTVQRRWVATICTAGAMALPGTAAAQQPDDPALTAVTVVGDAIEGSTLTAEVASTGAQASTHLQWLRCDATALTCAPIAGADEKTYVVEAADIGHRLRVAAELRRKADVVATRVSDPTAVVTAAGAQPEPPPSTEPPPAPDPEPAPAPTPSGQPAPAVADATQTPTPGLVTTPDGAPYTLPTASPLRYMRPFPVVRIRGELAAGGVRVTLLRVTSGRQARVRVTCSGRRCPVRRLQRGPGRIRRFERFLPAGLRITITVRRPGRIGKYVRLRIRDGRAPARTDACVLPGSAAAAPCPAP